MSGRVNIILLLDREAFLAGAARSRRKVRRALGLEDFSLWTPVPGGLITNPLYFVELVELTLIYANLR